MVLLQRLLLLPLLAPLLVVLLVGVLNPRPGLALRLLIWTSPALPIGAWIALGACGGAGLSAAGTVLALRTGPGSLRRQLRRPAPENREPWTEGRREPWDDPSERPSARRQADPSAPPESSAGPPRPPGDPAPTVAVPFRVIRKGRSPAGSTAAPSTASGPDPRVAQTTVVGDGWDRPESDDW